MMFKATLKSLLARKLRLLLSGLAVVLGVMAVSGALVLTDNLGRSFDALFQTVNQNLDVQVSGTQNVQGAEQDGEPVTRPIPATLVGTVAAVPGVRSAIGAVIVDGARVVGSDGKVIGSAGPPRFGVGWRGEVGFTQLRQGRGPQAPGEIALDAGLAKQGHFQLGDQVGVLTLQPKQTFTLVGIFGYTGGRDSLGGETRVAFTEPVAQQLMLGRQGAYSVINVQAQQGVSAGALRDAIQAKLGGGYLVRTRQQVAADQATDVEGSWASSAPSCSALPRSPCSSAASSSLTPSRSWSPSAPGSWRCCGPWAPAVARSSGRCWSRPSWSGCWPPPWAWSPDWGSRSGCGRSWRPRAGCASPTRS
jgi:putative ABC transport system permease protein